MPSVGTQGRGARHRPRSTPVASRIAVTLLLAVSVLQAGPTASALILTSVGLSAPLQTTGAAETWTVNFTTVSSVAGLGKVRVVFPAGFVLNSGGATLCDITAPGTVSAETTVAAGSQVDCVLGALDSIGAATAVTLTISNVKNPTTAQTTGAFTLQTRSSLDALIDEDTANTETITASALTGVAASAPLQQTGAVETWTFAFTVVNALASGDHVQVVFPAGFATSSGAATVCDVTAPLTVLGETTTVVSSTEVKCSLGALDTVVAGAAVALTLSNVKDPTTVQTTGAFQIRTRDAANGVHDQNTTNTESIAASTLTVFSASAPLQTAGAVETWIVAFTTVNAVASGGDVRVVFPAGFDANGPAEGGADTACAVTGAAGSGPITTTFVSDTEISCELGAGAFFSAANAISLTLTNVRNPLVSGTTGAFTVQTRDASDAVYDQHASNTESIAAGALTAATVAAPLKTAGEVETWTIGFTTTNPTGGGGDVRVVLPTGFVASSGAATVCDVAGLSGESTTVVSSTVVVCELGAGSLSAAAAVSLTLTNGKNPTTKAAAASFHLETRTSADAIVDAADVSAAIAAHPFSVGPTGVWTTQFQSNLAAVTVTLTTFNDWEADGRVVLEFPAGYGLDPGGAGTTLVSFVSGGSGVFAAPTVSGQNLTAARTGGATIPGGSAISLAVATVSNPATVGLAGSLGIATANATLAEHDRGTILGVTIFATGGWGGPLPTPSPSATPLPTPTLPLPSPTLSLPPSPSPSLEPDAPANGTEPAPRTTDLSAPSPAAVPGPGLLASFVLVTLIAAVLRRRAR